MLYDLSEVEREDKEFTEDVFPTGQEESTDEELLVDQPTTRPTYH